MYCQVCGTQLPSEARACPNCGTLTPASYSDSGASPYDPTAVAMSGSSPYAASAQLPPTQYGANPYEDALQSPYLANPYEVPPPPPPPRLGKRIGIIAGIVVLVLLLIGSGMFAWLRFSAAPASFTANGTFKVLNTTTTNTQQDGQNTIYTYTQQGEDFGDVTGTYTDEETLTLHPDSTGTFSATATCTCTIGGKSGTYMYSFNGTSKPDGSYQGQFVIFQGTGDLVNLHGQGTFQGKGNNGTYSGQLHFDA